MKIHKVAIVGGGLSGLYAAWLLERQDVDYVLLEARTRFGGRIISLPSATDGALTSEKRITGHFDLGPTWFWPDMQPELIRLLDELELPVFAQFDTGDMMVERSAHSTPERMRGFVSSPPSMRISGGMAALTETLRAQLSPLKLMLGEPVKQIFLDGDRLALETEQNAHRVDHILLALPPRLAVETIEFKPSLPEDLVQSWQQTATWMAPHAKYLAVFERPFWRDAGLSGSARSSVGPMAEIHDVSDESGNAALFGFIGVPADIRVQLSTQELKLYCRNQLVRLFGEAAKTPKAEFLKDWAFDPFTATRADQTGSSHPVGAPQSSSKSGPWQSRMTGIASEWSNEYPGYVAGAVDAAARGIASCNYNGLSIITKEQDHET